jgi:post-segregation antitoxin (ccd killing protein)
LFDRNQRQVCRKEQTMTTLELKLNLPDRLAREAQAAGLLTSQALADLLKDAMRRRAAQTLLSGAARATAAGSQPMSMDEIQAEVNAVRRARRARDPK